MKTWMKYAMIIYIAITTSAVSILSLEVRNQHELNRQLKQQVTEQSSVIDSLLRKRDKFIDVQLWVTDKSTNKIYGRYNKGTITMPQERKYILEVDSSTFNLK